MTRDGFGVACQVDTGKIVETYGYDADGARMVTVSGAITTIDLGGVWQE